MAKQQQPKRIEHTCGDYYTVGEEAQHQCPTAAQKVARELRWATALANRAQANLDEALDAVEGHLRRALEDIQRERSYAREGGEHAPSPDRLVESVQRTLLWMTPNMHLESLGRYAAAVNTAQTEVDAAQAKLDAANVVE